MIWKEVISYQLLPPNNIIVKMDLEMAIMPDKYIITCWYMCLDGENQNESCKQLHGVSKRNDYHSHDNPNGLLIVILGAGRYQDAYRWRGLRSNEDFPATRISQHEVSTSLNSKWYVTESTRKVKKKQSWPRKSSNSVPNPIALESAFSRDKASAKGRILLPNRMIFLKSAKGNEKRNDYHSHEYASGELILILGAGRYQDAFRCRDLRSNKDFPACCITSSTWPRSAKKSPKVRQEKCIKKTTATVQMQILMIPHIFQPDFQYICSQTGNYSSQFLFPGTST